MKKLVVVLLAFLVAASAQTQVATVTSDSGFELRGANVATGQGVPSWPVLPGDVIKAGPTPVTITFPDGSVLTLAPGSTAKVDLSKKKPVFELLSGNAHYSLSKLNAVTLMTGKSTVTATDLVGDLEFGGGKKLAAGWWTAGHTTLVIAAAGGATALGVGVAAANKPKKTSCGGQNQQGNNNCQ